MLPETRTGRCTESAQAGRHRHGEPGQELRERFLESAPRGLTQAGDGALVPGARTTCAERGARAGEESRPRCPQDPGPHSGLCCPRPVLPQTL